MRRAPWTPAMLLASVTFVLAPHLALPGALFAEGEPALTATELAERLEDLEAEIAEEEAQLARLEEAQEAELAKLRDERRQLAERTLDLEIERGANEEKLERLREQAAAMRSEQPKLESAVESLAAGARTAAERLRIHLREVPGSDAAIARLEEAASSLSSLGGGEDAAGMMSTAAREAIRRILVELGLAHDDAGRIHVRRAEIFTANGREEAVWLLALGHVRFGYVTMADGRAGLAFAAPDQASGYRWSEALPGEIAEELRAAVAVLRSSDEDVVLVPIDPTGRIGPDELDDEETLLGQIRAGGPVIIPICAVAAFALLLIIERVWVLYGRNRGGAALSRRVVAACTGGHAGELEKILARPAGTVGRVLAACLSRRDQGQRAMEDSIAEQLLHEAPRLQRFMSGIAILAAIAPLLGLLGTVTGIIRVFGVIRAFGNSNPSVMAGGISEALITTAAGLIIAVPVLVLHSMLRGRSDRILADAERHAASLLTLLVYGPASTAANKETAELARRERPPAAIRSQGGERGA